MSFENTLFGQVVDAYNNRDIERWLELVKDAVYTEVSTGETFLGDKAVYRSWLSAFDMRVEITRVVSQADEWEIMEGVLHGKHVGVYLVPSGEVAPTGRDLNLPILSILQAKEGRAVAIRHYYDLETMWVQLGARPRGCDASAIRFCRAPHAGD